jgi:hypothetical protein
MRLVGEDADSHSPPIPLCYSLRKSAAQHSQPATRKERARLIDRSSDGYGARERERCASDGSMSKPWRMVVLNFEAWIELELFESGICNPTWEL